MYNKWVFKACAARETAVYSGVNKDFEGKRKVAFKRGQRVLAHFAERSNQKELNAENTLSGNSRLSEFLDNSTHLSILSLHTLQ